MHPDDAHLAHQFLQQVIESPGEIVATELRCVVGDGTVRWVSCEATARRTEDGRIFLDGTTQDINDRKLADLERLKLQEHLLQGQKIESIGRLAGGIAHDFNNMLAVILGHSDVALSDESLPDNILKHFQAIQRAAERSADLTRQLLTFARRQMAPPQLVNLNVTIPAMLRMLERLIGKHIHLEWAPAEQNCTVYIDPSQADQ
ncbi:MAG: PAS domain-containing protein, partial [Planctomycetaceae bacterium]|nr:PAS domain-containing protein [Planctomycetaceae bacterium]